MIARRLCSAGGLEQIRRRLSVGILQRHQTGPLRIGQVHGEVITEVTRTSRKVALYDRIVFVFADPDAGVDMEGPQDMATYYTSVMGSKPVDARTLVDTSFAQSALKSLGTHSH